MIPSTVIGDVAGTGAAINVVLGFKPDYVKAVNRVSGAQLEWFRPAGTNSRKVVVAGTVSVVTGAASVAAYEGTTGEGFTIPADAQVNVSGQQIDYFATRSGPGAN